MRIPPFALAAVAASLLFVHRHAHACGGCFAAPPPPNANEPPALVTSHRMALSISTDQTVLWDQIRYSGVASEFAWVLPIKPGARVEVASDAWFDVLDAATQPLVTPPELECGSSESCSTAKVATIAPVIAAGSAMGCGDAGSDGALVLPELDGVDIVSHGSAGPYESVILHGSEPGALPIWLADHGYAIDDDIAPLIDDYVAEGFDFVALRLVPGAGVSQMKPVRVIQPGAVPVLPLRMVAAGSGPKVGLSLFVIAEGRYTPASFPEAGIDSSLLSFDFTSQTSNYGELREAIFARANDSTFLVPFSRRGALFSSFGSPSTGFPMLYRTTDGLSFTTIADAFIHQGFRNGETTSTDCASSFAAAALDTRRVVNACSADGACETLDGASQVDASTFACAPPIGSDLPFDDLAVALIGQHPRDVWVTRLDANLGRAALSTDLELVASPAQIERSAFIQAELFEGASDDCERIGAALHSQSGRSSGERARLGMVLALGLVLLAAVARRLGRAFGKLQTRDDLEVRS